MVKIRKFSQKIPIELLKRVGLLTSVRGLQVFLGLLTTYVLAHTLSIEKYGQYQFVLSVLGIVSIFSLTEFANTLMQSVARGFHGSFRTMFPYPLLVSCLGVFSLLGFAYWYGIRNENYNLFVCFLLASAFFPVTYGLRMWRGFKIGEEKFFDYTKLEVFILAFTNVGIIGTTLLFPETYIGAVFFVIAIPAFINLVMMIKILKSIPVDSVSEEGVISHGVKSSCYMAFSKISQHSDKLLLFIFVDAVAVALLAAADRVSDLLRSAVQDTATALAPNFAKSEKYTKRLDLIFKYTCVGFGVIMMVFAFTLLPHVINLIYGEQYRGATVYAQILILVLSINNLASFQFRYIRSKLDTKNVRDIMMIVSVSRVLMSLTFIPFMGLKGAILSITLYHILLAVITNYRIKRDYLS